MLSETYRGSGFLRVHVTYYYGVGYARIERFNQQAPYAAYLNQPADGAVEFEGGEEICTASATGSLPVSST